MEEGVRGMLSGDNDRAMVIPVTLWRDFEFFLAP
jgi:hypothetical protein